MIQTVGCAQLNPFVYSKSRGQACYKLGAPTDPGQLACRMLLVFNHGLSEATKERPQATGLYLISQENLAAFAH